MLAIVRNDSRVHQAELEKKGKEREKNEQPFHSEKLLLLVCSFAAFSASFLIALMSCTKDTLIRPVTRTQNHDYDEDNSSMVLASKSCQ